MLLVCPNCATSYQVEAAALGATGRSVRCVRCRTVWHASAPATAPMPAPPVAGSSEDDTVAAFRSELAGEPSPAEAETADPEREAPTAEADIAASAAVTASPEPGTPDETPVSEDPLGTTADTQEQQPTDSPALAPAEPMPEGAETAPAGTETLNHQPDDIETVASRRTRRAPAKGRRLPLPGLPVVIVALVAALTALIGWRGDIARHVPQLASLYSALGMPVNLRGLVFADVKTSHDIHDGVPVLVVEGTIVNAARVPVEVPRLRFSVRSQGSEIYAWTALPAQNTLEPGGALPFRSRLASPPAGSHDVLVRFFNRRDAVAGLR